MAVLPTCRIDALLQRTIKPGHLSEAVAAVFRGSEPGMIAVHVYLQGVCGLRLRSEDNCHLLSPVNDTALFVMPYHSSASPSGLRLMGYPGAAYIQQTPPARFIRHHLTSMITGV